MSRAKRPGRSVRPALAALALALSPVVLADDTFLRRFAELESIWAASVSPDGTHVLLGCNEGGVRAACVYGIDQPQIRPQIVLADTDDQLVSAAWAGPGWLTITVSSTANILGALGNRLRYVRKYRRFSEAVEIGAISHTPALVDPDEPILARRRSSYYLLSSTDPPLVAVPNDVLGVTTEFGGSVLMALPTEYEGPA